MLLPLLLNLWGALVDATYTIIGKLDPLGERVVMSDPSGRVSITAPTTRASFAFPEARVTVSEPGARMVITDPDEVH